MKSFKFPPLVPALAPSIINGMQKVEHPAKKEYNREDAYVKTHDGHLPLIQP
jgi:hypothetical protein